MDSIFLSSKPTSHTEVLCSPFLHGFPLFHASTSLSISAALSNCLSHGYSNHTIEVPPFSWLT